MEVKTGPCAPAGCGQPRLAGCNGPVLAVEWDPPMYDGGANLVAYRVWVRPFSATDADPSDLAIQVFSETFFFGGGYLKSRKSFNMASSPKVFLKACFHVSS